MITSTRVMSPGPSSVPEADDVFSRLNRLANKLGGIKTILGNTLATVRGIAPDAAGDSKRAEQPHLLMVLSDMDSLIYQIEESATELRDKIGS